MTFVCHISRFPEGTLPDALLIIFPYLYMSLDNERQSKGYCPDKNVKATKVNFSATFIY